MNSRSHFLSGMIGLLAGSLGLGGASLQFEFQDESVEDFGVSYAFGDVVNGVVVMDTDSGAFSVTWNLTGEGFLGPVHLNLHLFNLDIGNKVSLSGFSTGGFNLQSITFTSDELGVLDTSALADWQVSQEFSTVGVIDGISYVSGVYAQDWGAIDLALKDPVQFSGTIMAGPETAPPEFIDTDSDGIQDLLDEWNYSDTSDDVVLLGINTRIPNRVNGALSSETGYTLADIVQLLEMAAAEDAINHGQYVQELVRSYKMLVKDGLITQQGHLALLRIIVEHGK